MKRNKGIIAYGTEEDREKLAQLAALTRLSVSEWIIRQIRNQHAEIYGAQQSAAPSTGSR